MTDQELAATLTLIDDAFFQLAGIHTQGTRVAPHVRATDGKVYELRVLAWLLGEILAAQPGAKAELSGPPGSAIKLRLRPGKVDTSVPHLVIYREKDGARTDVACIWMNVEVTGVWSLGRRSSGTETSTDYHELDIAVTHVGIDDGKTIDPFELHVGVECKDREIGKETVREMLGIRRLISFYRRPIHAFPVRGFPPLLAQHPPSRLFLCSSQALKPDHDKLDPIHGIVVQHLPV